MSVSKHERRFPRRLGSRKGAGTHQADLLPSGYLPVKVWDEGGAKKSTKSGRWLKGILTSSSAYRLLLMSILEHDLVGSQRRLDTGTLMPMMTSA